MGLGVMSPAIVATMSDSGSKVLLETRMTAAEGQAAQWHIGEHYPILMSTYTAVSSSSSSTSTALPSFTYEDLGLILKVTPHLHGGEEATLEMDAEFKLLTGDTNNGLPVISNRVMKSTVRMALGEWAVLSGLLDTDDTYTIAGLAGAAHVPFLKALTSTHTKKASTDRVVILLRPRLAALPGGRYPTRLYRLGTETRPMVPL